MRPTSTDLSELLRGLAGRHEENLAVAAAQQELTFAGLDAAATAWAGALYAAGCGPQTCVGLLAPNCPDWLAVAFGVWRSGGTLVPISTFVTPRELAETLGHADIEVLVTAPRLKNNDYLAALAGIGADKLRHVVVLGSQNNGHQSAAHFLKDSSTAPAVSIDPESIACVLYTSGTTGRPKGVRLSHRAILSTTLPTAERSGLAASDSLLTTLPLFWVAGLVIRALPTLTTGCSLLFVETYTPDAVIEVLSARRPTALHLRPPQVAELLRHPRFDRGLLSRVHRGNGRVEWFAGHLPEMAKFITGYGMTEMGGYVTALDWRDSEQARHDGMGSPLPGVEIRIVGASGNPCPSGESGAIRVRGPGMFSGYHKEADGYGLDADGWFDTGDLGAVEADGTFRFAGRTKDLLRVKGINVSPIEVEQVLGRLPGVNAVYVVGLPPGGLEQRVVALVITSSDANADVEGQLRAVAAAELSHYKRPDAYVFLRLDEVPFGPTSKPQKDLLTQVAAERLEER